MPGASLELTWQVHPSRDPLKIVGVAFGRYCREWWQRTDKSQAQAATLEASVLVHAFQATIAHAPQHAWRTCRGPLSRIVKWLGYIGWSILGQTTFKTDCGVDVDIVVGLPAFVQEWFLASLKRTLLKGKQL